MGQFLYGKDLVPGNFVSGGGFARWLRNDDQPHHDFNNGGAVYDCEHEINRRSSYSFDDDHDDRHEHVEEYNADRSGGEDVFEHLEAIWRASDRHSLLVPSEPKRSLQSVHCPKSTPLLSGTLYRYAPRFRKRVCCA